MMSFPNNLPGLFSSESIGSDEDLELQELGFKAETALSSIFGGTRGIRTPCVGEFV